MISLLINHLMTTRVAECFVVSLRRSLSARMVDLGIGPTFDVALRVHRRLKQLPHAISCLLFVTTATLLLHLSCKLL